MLKVYGPHKTNNDPDHHPCEWPDCMSESESTRRCSGCKKAWYCSPECQKNAWTLHIFACKGPNARISPGYHLAKACGEDEIPIDPQTRKVYGFDRAARINAEGKLVGLYQGFFIAKEWKVEIKELDKWARDGTLVDHIKQTFEEYGPPGSRGLYYPWFLQNQWILNGSAD